MATVEIQDRAEQKIKILRCPSCGELNPRKKVYCRKCHYQLRRSRWKRWKRRVWGTERRVLQLLLGLALAFLVFIIVYGLNSAITVMTDTP